ncbi:MAG: 3D domain-containing protein [Acidobacteriota bacterium]|nr:3D domain-containing protein [Acidobacteriota bacterium]
MKNLARGSVFLFSLVALIVSLFYLQPQVEAVTTSISADLSNSQQVLLEQQEKQDKKSVTKSTVAENESQTTNNKTEEKTANSTSKNVGGFSATAYCLRGRTASGGSVRKGIVAADPRVLPLGTRIYVNAGGYSGNYIVADTGGAVRGRKLDIWVPNCSEAMRFGRRTVSVNILGRG